MDYTQDVVTIVATLKSIEMLLSEQVEILRDIRAATATTNTKLETIKRQGY